MLGLSFVDQLHGYISARYDYSPPAIYRTSDGGETWDGASIQNPPGFQAGQPGYSYAVLHITRFGNVYYLDAHGSSPGGDTGYVFESTDSGASWKYLVTTPVPPESLGFVTVTRWLLLIGSDGSGQETTDAGKTWHTYASGYSQAAPIAPQVVFGDASVGYATVRGGIERTVDGGMHWTAIQTPGVQQTG